MASTHGEPIAHGRKVHEVGKSDAEVLDAQLLKDTVNDGMERALVENMGADSGSTATAQGNGFSILDSVAAEVSSATQATLPVCIRRVHFCQLLSCSCVSVSRPLLWITAEERPRCFECLNPIREQVSELLVSERWLLLVLGLMERSGTACTT